MASNFLQAAGTNGYLGGIVTAMTTDLNTWANAGVVLSSVGGASGVFTQASTANAIWAEILYLNGSATTTPTGVPNIAGWFVRSQDGGTTFEPATAALPRAADFVIPLPAAALVAGQIFYASGRIALPAGSYKILVQNNSGVALTSTGNKLILGPVAIQY